MLSNFTSCTKLKNRPQDIWCLMLDHENRLKIARTIYCSRMLNMTTEGLRLETYLWGNICNELSQGAYPEGATSRREHPPVGNNLRWDQPPVGVNFRWGTTSGGEQFPVTLRFQTFQTCYHFGNPIGPCKNLATNL